MTVANLCKSQC